MEQVILPKATFPREHTLGVITCFNNHHQRPPFLQEEYLKQLSQEGKKIGMHVMIFSPKEVNWNTRTVSSWFVDGRDQWIHGLKKLPSLIYDRCSYINSRHYMSYKPHLLRILQDPHLRLLGRGLRGKWQTYGILQQNPDLQPFLPLTLPYRSLEDVIDFIQKYEAALIKPNAGSSGCGVVAISKQEDRFLVQGRSISNQPFQKTLADEDQLKNWILHFIGKKSYLIQSYLMLTTPDQRPFDIRVLVQKNQKKDWQTTGMAVRTGQPHFITSNLNGGGQAAPLRPFLQKNYPEHLVPAIVQHIETISQIVPPFIEKHHGPLVELGIDIGVDPQGKGWILEVNSKPGRTIFIKTGEFDIRQRAVQLPIYYARALLIEH